MLKWLQVGFENQRRYEIALGVIAGLVFGFGVGWLWKQGPTSSEATKLVDVFIAVGTVGATFLSLFFWYLQNKKQSQLIKKEAFIILANQNKEITALISGAVSARYSGAGLDFTRKGQKKITAMLVPSNDLVDARYNKLLRECGEALAYAEMRAGEGESIEEILQSVGEKLKQVQDINIKCWKELGYYWVGNKDDSLVAHHEIPANYWLSQKPPNASDSAVQPGAHKVV